MKEIVRSLVAGTAGAVVVATLVVTQPALADGAAKAHAQITSAMIKNGTIQRRDLDRQLATAASKANTALQRVPDASVTGSKVADGSLSAKDLALATGSSHLDFPSLATNVCVPSGAIETGHVVTGGLILVSAPSAVVGSVQVFAREDAGSNTAIDIVACNNGGTFDPPASDFTWAVIAP